ncbi:MAG: formyltransferase family protein [Trichodesmium sp.]
MTQKKFYLLTDPSIICSYLVSKWIEAFEKMPEFQGILVKEEVQSSKVITERKNFHQKYFDQKHLTDEIYELLTDLYPDIEQTERAMIERYGVSKYSTTEHSQTIFLGDNLNGKYAKNWLMEVAENSSVFIFVCATQILKSWWLEITKNQVFNSHTAVLPYARGMYAIENMAINKNINQFKQAAGVTIHYVDKGVDTGSIIRTERIVDPFRFNSIWDLKGYLYVTEFELYVKTAQDILRNNETIPAGVTPDPKLLGPNFRIKNFTPEKQKQAADGYLWMKNSWQ